MSRLAWILALLVVGFFSFANQGLATEGECPVAPPSEWTELVDRTNALLEETQLVFAQGAIAFSPASADSNRELALEWIDLGKRWRDIEVPEEREVIGFTANRMSGHMTTLLTQFVQGEQDSVQLGKTAEAMDAYTTATGVFIILNLGCGVSTTH